MLDNSGINVKLCWQYLQLWKRSLYIHLIVTSALKTAEISKLSLTYNFRVWSWKHGKIELKKYITFHRNMSIIWGIVAGKYLSYFVEPNPVLLSRGKGEF